MNFIDFFAGIGGFRLAFERAGHICVGHCEIDKFADRSYRAMHEPKEGEFYASDIQSIEPADLPSADIYTFGFPCQSFSVAGKRAGFGDTRGTLIFEILRLASIRKPKYLVGENVAGLLSHDNGSTFRTILSALEELGYYVEWQIINSKFYVPQNRERIYIIGHFGKRSGREIFPIRIEDEESDNESKIRIVGSTKSSTSTSFGTNSLVYSEDGIMGALLASDYKTPKQVAIKQVGNIVDDTHRSFKNPQSGRIFMSDGISPALTTAADVVPKIIVKEATKKGYAVAKPGDSINLERLNSNKRRGRVGKGVAQTLTTSCNQATIDGIRVRKLTPRECFRLQGFPDSLFDKARKVNSDSQLYKQAGNSISVPVVYEIAKRITE